MKVFSFRKGLRVGGLFFILILNGLWWASFTKQHSAIGKDSNPVPDTVHISAQTAETVPPSPTEVLDSVFTVVGVGDMMLGTNYPSASYLPPNDGKNLLDEVRDILKNADVTFGNHEGAMLDKGGTAKTCRDPSVCYVFRSPTRYAKHFADAGFDFLSIANNHSGDFGPEGRRQTKAAFEEAGIAYAGLAGTDETAIIERNGIKYGMCAFAPNSGTCDLRDIAGAQAIVKRLVEQVDVVIVSFHGGAEGADHQHVPRKTEMFHGENRGNVHKFAHAVIDAGADIVFGHGPHVTRAAELYKDRFIIYSMGNFCTYGRFSLSGPAGIAPLISLKIKGDGTFVEGQITPTYQQKAHGPKIDRQERVIKTLIDLSKTDFPESALHIQPDGKMKKKG